MKYYMSLSMPFMLGPILHAFYDARGLLVSDYYILFAVGLGCVFLFELPTGVIADKVGYKQSLLLGSLFTVISLFFMIYAINIWYFIVAEVIFAIGAAFISGADSGLIYDTLVNLNREKEYASVFGKSRQFIFVAAGIGSLVSSMLFTIQDTLPFILNVVFVVISFVIMLFVEEPIRTKRNHNYREQINVVRKHVFRTKKIWAVILMSSIVFAFYRPSFNLIRPFLKSVEVDIFYYGIIFFGLNIIANFASRKVDTYFKLVKGYPLLGLIIVLLINFLLYSVPVLGVGLMAMGVNQIVRSLYRPVITNYVNELTTSDIRATTLSFVSLINNVAAAGFALILSLFVNYFVVHDYVLILSGLLVVITLFTYSFINRRYGIK